MNIHKLKFLSVLLLIFSLTSCFSSDNKSLENDKKNWIISQENISEEIPWDLSKYNDVLLSLWTKNDLKNLQESLNNWDFKKNEEVISFFLWKIEEKKDLNEKEKKLKSELNLLKAWNILNEWNYLYREKESQKKAEKIINDIILADPDYVDPFYSNYLLWYSKEINRDFSWALIYYNKALDSRPDIEKNSKLRSIILNQIWHLYDLSWDVEKAYTYYIDAYKKDNKNYSSSVNIARYLTRKWLYKDAKKYFEYRLNTDSKPRKSEIYFSLSSIELELNWLTPDIQKSIEYAKKSIEEFPKYPMWYTALARGYYMLNDSKYDKDIENNLNIAIKLNPNNSYAYEILALFTIDKLDLKWFFIIMNSTLDKIKVDPIVVWIDKNINSNNIINSINLYIIIKSIIDWKTDKNNIYDDLLELYKDNKYNFLIKNELKRKNYWIFKNINKNEIDKLINNIKKYE